MQPSDQSSYELALELRTALASPTVLTAEQAKLYSQAVRLGWHAGGLKQWNQEKAASQFDDAARLIEAAGIAREAADEAAAADLYRRAGDILEWLYRATPSDDDPLRPLPLALYASACYQLAGFPAMALGLLAGQDKVRAVSPVFAAFLRGDFYSVLALTLQYWRDQFPATGARGSWEVSAAASPEGAAPPATILELEVVRCLGLIAHSLCRNDRDRLAAARKKLRGMAKYAARTTSEYTWLALSLCADVADDYATKSIWSGIELIEPLLSEQGKSACIRFVREQYRGGRGLLWPSQRAGIQRLATGTSFAMCTPTGSGKTTIAEIALLQGLYPRTPPTPPAPTAVQSTAPLALYLVPSRALAAEVESRLAQDLCAVDTGITITGLYGGTEWGLTDVWLRSEQPTILISTVEMAEALVRYSARWILPRLTLVVIDEAHQVQFHKSDSADSNLFRSENRAARLESFASRLFSSSPQCRAIALSAVAGGAETAIASWVSRAASSDTTGSNYRSTRQLVGALECRQDGGARIRLELMNGKRLLLADRDQEAYIPLPFAKMPRLTGGLRSQLSAFVQCHTLWAAIQLARAGQTVLISVMQRIETTIGRFREALTDHKAWQIEVPPYFTPPAHGPRASLYRSCLDACRDYCGEESHELFLLGKGIAIHHGQLPVRVRRLMTEVIRARITSVVVATSTLTEGVNLPFDVVIVSSIVRSQKTGDQRWQWQVIPPSEFMNLAGRAGRPGTGVEGITLVALPVEPTAGVATQSRASQAGAIAQDASRFAELLRSIEHSVNGGSTPSSPLARLLEMIWKLWVSLNARPDGQMFFKWLEEANPKQMRTASAASPALDDLPDALDSLDLFLVSAVEEAEELQGRSLQGIDLEAQLKHLWSRTYAAYAAQDVAWLERVFVTRGNAIPTKIYPKREERRLLYRLGLPPGRGLSFLDLAAEIEAILRNGLDYAARSQSDQYRFVESVAALVQTNGAFPFRSTADLPWQTVLQWWLRAGGGKSPDASEVCEWLDAATHNFEYRLGTAVGAATAGIWDRLGGGVLTVPTLDEWRSVTDLPWVSFWLRELLAWGTLDPVVAFLMAMGRTTTRLEAEQRVAEYYKWHNAKYPGDSPDGSLHPMRLKTWDAEVFPRKDRAVGDTMRVIAAKPIRDIQQGNKARFPVIPLPHDNKLLWLDAAGFLLAESAPSADWLSVKLHEFDFTFDADKGVVEATS